MVPLISLTVIDILVNMLKKEKKRAKDSAALLQRLGHNPPGSARDSRHYEVNESVNVRDSKQYEVNGKVNGHDTSAGSRSTPGSRMNTGNSDDWRRPPSGTGISKEKQRQRIEHDAKVKKKICKFINSKA